MLSLAVLFATFASSSGLVGIGIEGLDPGHGTLVLFLSAVVALTLAMARRQLYDLDYLGWGSGEFTRIPQSLALGVVALVLVTYGARLPALSREWVALTWLMSSVLVASGRIAWRTVTSRIRTAAWLERPTLIVGSNSEAAEIARILRSDRSSHLVPLGCVSSSLRDQLSLDFCSPAVPRLGEARDLPRIVEEQGVDTVVLVASAFDTDVLQRMIREMRDRDVHIQITSGLSDVLMSRVFVRAVSGVPVIALRGVSFSPANLGAKRVFDVVVGSAVMALGTPIWLAMAVLIKLTSRGPVFYKQTRIGQNGVPFEMYKFRSMSVDAEARLHEVAAANEADGPLFKIADDPRLTPIGSWMRRYSIDEFPQLINVIRGELSLVGPRPPLPSETNLYTDYDWRRLEVIPGMTGLWQVSGRSDLSFQEMVRLDLFYIENWSVRLDVSLLMRTVPAVLFAKGAY